MSGVRQHALFRSVAMLSHGATLINISAFGPSWALIYAAQEMVKAGYSDDEIMGWLAFALSAERASQERMNDE